MLTISFTKTIWYYPILITKLFTAGSLIQISQRNNKSGIGKIQGKAIELPTIIEILLELLRSFVWDVKTISKNLHARKIFVTEPQIKEVMRHYDLKKNSKNDIYDTQRGNHI